MPTFVIDVGDVSNNPVEFFTNDVNITDLIKYHVKYVKVQVAKNNIASIDNPINAM